QQNSVALQHGQRRGHEFAIIFLRLKSSVLFRPGKRRRIEHDAVELPLACCEAAQPLEDVAINEIVPGRIEPVEREIPFAPFEIFLGKVKTGRACAGLRRADRETARVGERVEYFQFRLLRSALRVKERKPGRDMSGEKPPAVVALIEKQADRTTFVKAKGELNTILANDKLGGRIVPERLPSLCDVGFANLPGEEFVV